MRQNELLFFGFTLIELLVAISIIGIIALGAISLNFNKVTSKEKLISFNNKIISNIETIRNNSLMGKGITANLIVPDSWRIDFDFSGSGRVLTTYSGSISLPEYDTIFTNGYYLDTIRCLRLDGTPEDTFTGSTNNTGSIIITKNILNLSGDCTNPPAKILEITTGFHGFTGSILINTVSGLVGKN